MLRFHCSANHPQSPDFDLSSAYLFGSDGVPLRAEIEWKDGLITCTKRAAGPAGLAILRRVEGAGAYLMETTRLLEREEPYVLALELARGQLMRIHHKREEWGLFDASEIADLNADILRATDLLITALKAESPKEASAAAEQSLSLCLATGDRLTKFHADVLLERRKQTAGFSRRVFGCQADVTLGVEKCGRLLADNFNFAALPVHWKQLEPAERSFQWKPLDAWVEWLTKNRVPIKASSLICFDAHSVPDWLYVWERDFETIRDLVADHIRRVVNRYGGYIQVWDVVSGLHGVQRFSFNFEQLIELTRLAVTVTKQLAPRATTIIDVTAPWGEYYARNQRTIPPMLYLDMAIQSGISFDAIGLQFYFGARADGMYLRDMLQIAALIDRFGNFGKPVHVTAVTVPSVPAAVNPSDGAGAPDIAAGGAWRRAWDENLQAQWIREFCEIVLARPFVETVAWSDLVDAKARPVASGGLFRGDLAPKKSLHEFLSLRKEIVPHGTAG